MSSSVKYSIDGTTNADEVSGKVKKSITSIEKQVEGIGNKFKTSFKDIFLSFLGPMALLGTALGFIGKMIADNAKKHEDANQAAIDQTNKLMSAEDNYWANKRNNEKKDKEKVEEAKTQRQQTTYQFLTSNDKRAVEMVGESIKRDPIGTIDRPYSLSFQSKVQEQVQAWIAEDMKKNPIKMAGKDSAFSGPQGFSNIIGVGANPVLENLTRQTDIQEQILEHIKSQAPNAGRLDLPDFTKPVPLTLQKAGIA
jgi:hypothetical protein